ncbi:MAG: hypothetical protein R8P61_26120 [Bacteroidia bacterium]|nr:hypothetical protein [Bacteroidia bacterium]
MKPLVHTTLLALLCTLGLFPQSSFSQDKLSNWYIEEVFLLADLNEDKYLSESEILQLRENFAYYQNPEYFERTDKNKDGYLDYPEFRYRFGQALVHRQEIDGKELKILSESFPYFEDAAYKYLKRHPELTERLMNNLLWTREHPDLMKQIIADKAWLSKEKAIVESLSSNLIWLSENPVLAKKFYQAKKLNPVSNIWRSWSISHMDYLANNSVQQGIQIDFPYWPAEEPNEKDNGQLTASAPSPGERQQWVDSLLMANQSLQLANEKVKKELGRRDSVAKSIFSEQMAAPDDKSLSSLKKENGDLRTRVRQMMIEKKLSRIEEDKLLETTIRQRKQIALFEKQQELKDENGNLGLNNTALLEEDIAKLKEDLLTKDQRIAELNESLGELNSSNMNLLKEKQTLAANNSQLKKEKGKLLTQNESKLKSLSEKENTTEKAFSQKEETYKNQIASLEEESSRLSRKYTQLEKEKDELESNLTRVLESKDQDTDELIAIEGQYKQQITALEIELEEAQAKLTDNSRSKQQKISKLEAELQESQAKLADNSNQKEQKIADLEAKLEKAENRLANNSGSSQERIKTLEGELEKSQAQLAERSNNYKEEIAELKVELKTSQSLIAEKTTDESNVKELQSELSSSKAEIASLQSRIDEFQSNSSLRRENDLQIQKKKYEQEIANLEESNEKLTASLEQNNKQMVALLAEQDALEQKTKANQSKAVNPIALDPLIEKQRDSLEFALQNSLSRIGNLEEELKLSEQALKDQEKQLELSKSSLAANSPAIDEEYDALYLRVNELEYNNAKLKDELEATLSLAGEREAILEKRLKSSMQESKRIQTKMNRFKRRKRFYDSEDGERMDKMALELADKKKRIKEMDEVNRALLAQLHANNKYLGQNISKRDQYQQEMTRLKSDVSRLESANDSLSYLVANGKGFNGPQRDSLLAYQERIYRMEQRILYMQNSNQTQLARLNLEIDSLVTEVSSLEEEKASIARVQKVEASRSQLTDDRERKLIMLQQQLEEKDLTLRQKEKVIQAKMNEITQKEKKYQDMRKWEEELHLLERKLKINPAYKKAKEDN